MNTIVCQEMSPMIAKFSSGITFEKNRKRKRGKVYKAHQGTMWVCHMFHNITHDSPSSPHKSNFRFNWTAVHRHCLYSLVQWNWFSDITGCTWVIHAPVTSENQFHCTKLNMCLSCICAPSCYSILAFRRKYSRRTSSLKSVRKRQP